MFSKRKLKDQASSYCSNNNKKSRNDSIDARSIDDGHESGFHSAFVESTTDFSLPPVKRKSLTPRKTSKLQKQHSFEESSTEAQQQTSDYYSSLLSSTAGSPARRSGSATPKKRKHDVTTSDENFYNSHSFVSPLKVRKKENCAKLILKEKSSSENVIVSSTPVQNKNSNRWSKFRSFHPEKFATGKSLDDAEPIEKLHRIDILPKNVGTSATASFDYSSFDLTNTSFNLSEDTTNEQQHHDIPKHVQQLWTGSIKLESKLEKTIATKSQENIGSDSIVSLPTSQSTIGSNSFESVKSTRNYCGRKKLNILGKLHTENNFPMNLILGHLNGIDLLSLSHVSKEYREIIKSNNLFEDQRQNYLKAYLAIKENKLPPQESLYKEPSLDTTSKRVKVFGSSNMNQLTMQLRPKAQSPPVSPNKKRFHDYQKLARSHKGPFKKCPRCGKPATINFFKIRSSPRKRKFILKADSTGRIQKQPQTFLTAKPSIDVHFGTDDQLFVTYPLMDDQSRSTSASSSCGSPSSPSSSEESAASGSEMPPEADNLYEYGTCSGVSCKYKFCVKCNCRFHPRTKCPEFSPASPSKSINTSVACSSRSLKSLKRLVY